MEESKRKTVHSRGIHTPIVKQGDDLIRIVVDSLPKDEIQDDDIIGVTESVLAIAQGNFVDSEDVAECISTLFGEELVIVDPIQSRNRFLDVLKAVALAPKLKKITIVLTYPSDEVGNHLISEEKFWESGIGNCETLTTQEFYEKVGKAEHPITGINYIEEYEKACNGKANIVLCNDFSKIPSLYGKDILVCSIHRREIVKRILEKNGAQTVYDLSKIMSKPIGDSGYSPEFGVYGTNKMAGGKLKLMPRNAQEFVEKLQQEIQKELEKKVEVLVFGDGAFKDPITGIWELADPTTTLGETSGLQGMPVEVKLKYLADMHKDKTPEEIEQIVKQEKEKRRNNASVSDETALGTTPRKIKDLVASLCDLTCGSGDKGTPVILIQNYF